MIVDLGHMLVSFSRQEVRRYYDIESKWLGYKRVILFYFILFCFYFVLFFILLFIVVFWFCEGL